eukprot:CAMPEP_0172866488 /NCGR_PEP_ID=MMETSP1075-20121228/82016_1 /TAXON_ID=2916 /ORGANISM="Ceratium fusus, Strain PA161109" /LENGTH=292 /DNA_ID=CAMNT_0013715659 /DNA_START=43 /DNA_END=918 /DNA_ORIENTATION=-
MDTEDAHLEVERAGVSAYLKDALAVLLEVRPADPLLFLNAYFRHAAQPEDTASLAWYLVRACPRSRPCFRDNLHSAFSALSRQIDCSGSTGNLHGGGMADRGVPATEMTSLLRLLCRGLPPEVAEGLLTELRPPEHMEQQRTAFPAFVLAVEACLAAEEASHQVANLFDACDATGRGRLQRDELLAELEQLRSSNVGASRRLQQSGLGCSQNSAGEEIAGNDGEDDLPGLPSALLEDIPSQESLRGQLSEFEAEDFVSADDLFVALWRLWRREEDDQSDERSCFKEHLLQKK